MKPKVKKVLPDPLQITYEVVVEDNAKQFGEKAQKLVDRNFAPVGSVSMTVFNNKLFVGQAFVRPRNYQNT